MYRALHYKAPFLNTHLHALASCGLKSFICFISCIETNGSDQLADHYRLGFQCPYPIFAEQEQKIAILDSVPINCPMSKNNWIIEKLS